MPAVSTPSKVLLTGGSGFLGAWITKYLLEAGYKVRATVRSTAKGDYLKNLFSEHGESFEYSIVDDIISPGAFDQAVNGVDAIIHTASPLVASDPKADPSVGITTAVEGTLNILKSAQKEASIKRMVITSSVGSVLEPKPDGYVYTEEDWNHGVVKLVKAQGRDANPMNKYAASKVLAELAAWDWLKTNSPSFDVTFTLPELLFGPVISETTKDIGGSNGLLLGLLKEASLRALTPEALKQTIGFVNVRDTAEEHVKALSIPEAGNERILSSGYVWSVQDILEVFKRKPVEGIVIPEYEEQVTHAPYSVSKEKVSKILGTVYRPGEDTILDTVRFALSIGWQQQ